MMEAEINKFAEDVIALAAKSGLDAAYLFNAMTSLVASLICAFTESDEGRSLLTEIAVDSIREAVEEISQ